MNFFSESWIYWLAMHEMVASGSNTRFVFILLTDVGSETLQLSGAGFSLFCKILLAESSHNFRPLAFVWKNDFRKEA